jgi:hypothetical protein
VSARDPGAGSRWHSADGRERSWNLRLLTHIFVLAVALPPLTVTVAQANSASTQHHRIVLAATVKDRPEAIRDIPADPPPPPPPPPAPAPAPAPIAKPVVAPLPPSPPPRPRTVYATGPVADVIRAAAARYGTDPNTLLRVAMCESGLNPNSYNSRSGATGLFQFKPGTFYGHGGHNIWDPADQADIAAKMFSQGLAYEWSCK